MTKLQVISFNDETHFPIQPFSTAFDDVTQISSVDDVVFDALHLKVVFSKSCLVEWRVCTQESPR